MRGPRPSESYKNTISIKSILIRSQKPKRLVNNARLSNLAVRCNFCIAVRRTLHHGQIMPIILHHFSGDVPNMWCEANSYLAILTFRSTGCRPNGVAMLSWSSDSTVPTTLSQLCGTRVHREETCSARDQIFKLHPWRRFDARVLDPGKIRA